MSAERNLDQVRFDILRNALYHTAMRRRFDRLDRWGNFLVVLLGATTVVKPVDSIFGFAATQVFGVVTTMIGAAKLAFGFSATARTHEALQRRYFDILASIEAHPCPSDEDVRGWYAAMVKTTADEPPVNHLVDAISYNEAANTLGHTKAQTLHIPIWAGIIGKVSSLHGYRFESVEERTARKLSPAE